MTRSSLHIVSPVCQPSFSRDANMGRYSPATIKRMDDIISANAYWDDDSEQYVLFFDDLDDLNKEELSASLMIDDTDFAHEFTGADNDAFEGKMLPALIRFLQNTTDKEALHDFAEAWKEGCANYPRRSIEDLLERRLSEYNYWMREDDAIRRAEANAEDY